MLFGTSEITSISINPNFRKFYNLEVDVDHVYRVQSNGILVHNSCGWNGLNNIPGVDLLSKNAAEMKKGRLTRAGHSLDKHKNRENTAFKTSSTKPKDKNIEAQNMVDNILTTPGSVFIKKMAKKNGVNVEVIYVIAPDGQGFRFDIFGNGDLTAFREP